MSSLELPLMKGEARMARGMDGNFEVPIFSHVIDNLWQGCSPAEFPDEMAAFDYDPIKAYLAKDPTFMRLIYGHQDRPVSCKLLYEPKKDPAEIDVPRFDTIVNLYKWGEYNVPAETDMYVFEMFDGDSVDEDSVESISDFVIDALEKEHKVLVHCQAGLNRSSLIVARVLMKKYGKTADEAIDMIRAQRSPLCLCNDTFRQWLKGLV